MKYRCTQCGRVGNYDNQHVSDSSRWHMSGPLLGPWVECGPMVPVDVVRAPQEPVLTYEE